MPEQNSDVVFTPSAEDKNLMHAHLQTLDPEGKGVTLDKLRTFYPKTGWSPILVTLRALVSEGRARTAMRGQPVAFEYFIWQ